MQLNVLGAYLLAHPTSGSCCTETDALVDVRPEEDIQAAEQAEECAKRAETSAPLAKDNHFQQKHRWEHEETYGRLIEPEEPHDPEQAAENETYWANQTEDGESEQSGGRQDSNEHDEPVIPIMLRF
jgi:hypothetical protein